MNQIISSLCKGINTPVCGEFIFRSSDHIRFQNGQDVSGHNYNCHRSIKIEANINRGEGYSVTIFNDDSVHPLWGNNVQMAPKPMKVIRVGKDFVTLKGFGSDIMGASFADYALTVVIENGEVVKCVLHLIDRNVDLHYLK